MVRLFLEFFSSVSVNDVQKVLTLKQVTTLRHSIGFQGNLVYEQTILSPTSCSKKISDLFLSFLHNFGFSKNGILQVTRRVLGCKSEKFRFGYLIKHRNYQAMYYFKAWLIYTEIQYFTVLNH